ncbi:hypothetical protein GPECTOR_32g510 [Gonium pectorale]|uniref:Protein kinase domain-containing protein n=1 Tax=Gonium pectorale TaxID=33097 RepID=A0A150GDG9_GONPE|nr:hypothetical protein GPECTOR_32g510 [Gonium pectorale]|eukprot:KXZ47897.1 hypothetical protein GPECTOR_32g510 [Gonium pectorale]
MDPEINLEVKMGGGGEVQLLPTLLGKGSFGRVVVGLYGGQRVAVKILHHHLLAAVETAEASIKAPAKAKRQAEGPEAEPGQAGGAGGAGDGGQRKVPAAVALVQRALAQEVAVLARCNHPNIIRLMAASLTPTRLCMVMELMETSLERVLHGGKQSSAGAPTPDGALLPLPKVLYVGIQIARALSYLHPTILHRDLKPANVLLSNVDSSQPVVKLADIYALGVILWEMLTGQRPWHGVDLMQVAYNVTILHDRLPLHIMPLGRCSLKLRALITRCWEPEPARRPAAHEVAKELAMELASLQESV